MHQRDFQIINVQGVADVPVSFIMTSTSIKTGKKNGNMVLF